MKKEESREQELKWKKIFLKIVNFLLINAKLGCLGGHILPVLCPWVMLTVLNW